MWAAKSCTKNRATSKTVCSLSKGGEGLDIKRDVTLSFCQAGLLRGFEVCVKVVVPPMAEGVRGKVVMHFWPGRSEGGRFLKKLYLACPGCGLWSSYRRICFAVGVSFPRMEDIIT